MAADGQGDWETGRQGDSDAATAQNLPVSPSPCLLVFAVIACAPRIKAAQDRSSYSPRNSSAASRIAVRSVGMPVQFESASAVCRT
jgi:hypothetical protein